VSASDRCDFCDLLIEQPQGRGRRRRFCAPRCRAAFYRMQVKRAQVKALSKNTENRRIADTIEGMEKYIVRTHGGGAARLGHSTIDGCKRDLRIAAKIDERLAQIFNGMVPRGRAKTVQKDIGGSTGAHAEGQERKPSPGDAWARTLSRPTTAKVGRTMRARAAAATLGLLLSKQAVAAKSLRMRYLREAW